MKKIIGLLAAGLAFTAAVQQISAEVTLSGKNVAAKNFATIQEALDAIGSDSGSYTIKVPKGTYEEVLYYNGAADITLSGDTSAKYGEDVVIAVENNGDLLKCKQASGQKARCVFEFEGTGNLTVENITFHNTFLRKNATGSNGQAETIGFDSTGNLAAYNCAFKSYQDTLRMTGKSWFYQCYVEGDTDFIWMEESGKVALFEECELVSLFDEFHTDPTSYIGAPRMTIGNKAAKGLVIFNSKISSQDGEKTYLARTPWNSGYYNQVAFVNSSASGIEKSLWKGNALTAEGVLDTVIGWKIDKATAESIGAETDGKAYVLSDSDVKSEFSGRDSILNRYYDITTLKYKKDLESYWDVKNFAKEHGWKVSKDSSKSLLSGEEKAKLTTYTFADEKSYKDLSLEGFAVVDGKLVGEAGSKITIPVKAKSVVSVTGCAAGNGTIKAAKQGESFYDFNTGSPVKFKEKAYVVYAPSAVTITATKKTTISKITVLSDKKVEFVPVQSIEISSADNAKMIYGKKSLQFSASLTPVRPTNADYEWTVSDSNIASIDETGFLISKPVAEDTEITVKATAKDEKGVSGEFKLVISKPDPNSFSVTWLDSLDASNSLEGRSDNEDIAKANKAVPSAGTWKHNASKINATFAKGGITYTGYSGKIEGKDTLYVDFPITAQENLEINEIEAAFGNHGTSNVAVLIQGISGGKKTELALDESRKARSAKKTYEVAYTINKGSTANIRVILYGRDGNGETAIAGGKAPTIATITISGKRK
ncbi:pectinesterase family protein [uncultured Treponema sp.]|uniref:pectinesterase family protein n=1 Tax=uncultured Treponema sp. TaxID=162155 RepID=UPI0025EB786C|nr:pectinesterase family protein [uncultured Treponema sp.]